MDSEVSTPGGKGQRKGLKFKRGNKNLNLKEKLNQDSPRFDSNNDVAN